MTRHHRIRMARSRRGADLLLLARLFLRIDGARLLLGAVLATLVVLAGMALLGISGWFISATGLAGLGATAALSLNVLLPSAAIRLLALVRTFGRYGERLVTHDATLAVVADLRERLFRAWATPAAARALLRRPARVLFRLTCDLDALESIYLRLLVPGVAATGAVLLAAIALGVLHPLLGLALGGWLLVAGGGIGMLVAGRARLLALRRARQVERLREAAVDLVAGQTDLLMAGRLQAQCDLFAAHERKLAHSDDALHRLDTGAGWAHALAGHVAVAAVLLGCAALVDTRTIGAPAAALAILLTLTALEPFAALRRGALEAGRSMLAARRVAPRLRAADQATDHTQARLPVPAHAADALLLVGASVLHAGRAAPALRAIDLRIGVGERVALLGASGAGKSTLLGVAAGEWPLQAGQVAARPACLLSQRVALFQDSLRDNLRLAAPAASDEQLWAALREAGLERDVRQLPQGLATMLGEGGLGLSGGQARRLALARLLLRDADVWLLDEVTEALDAATAADVLARLAIHAQGKTVLLACHTRREAMLAERIVTIEAGRIVGDARVGTAQFAAALAGLRTP